LEQRAPAGICVAYWGRTDWASVMYTVPTPLSLPLKTPGGVIPVPSSCPGETAPVLTWLLPYPSCHQTAETLPEPAGGAPYQPAKPHWNTGMIDSWQLARSGVAAARSRMAARREDLWGDLRARSLPEAGRLRRKHTPISARDEILFSAHWDAHGSAQAGLNSA